MAELKAYLTLIGDNFDTEYVTKKTGMQPAEIRERDELLDTGRAFGHTEWGIETETIQAHNIVGLMDQLISQVSCDSSTLLELCDECAAEWHILILVKIYDDESPALYFSSETIQFAASIHAKIGFDMYIL